MLLHLVGNADLGRRVAGAWGRGLTSLGTLWDRRGPEVATDCHSAEGDPTPTPALDSERPRDGVGTKVWCLAAPAASSSLPSEQRAD